MLAALAGLAAIAVVGQALARQAAAEGTDHSALAALGLSPRQFAAVSMLRTLAVAAVGAAGAIVLATLLSPLARAGEARLAEPAPGLSFDAAVIGLGALATVAVVLALGVPPALRSARARSAADRVAMARHIGRHHDNAYRPVVPASLVNFGESANFPLLLGGIVALCGLATLGHLLVVSVARRRTENELLMALGMVRRQRAAIVFWQATTVAIVAIAVGIPLGIAAGQAIWRAFAVSLVVVPVPVVHAWLIGVLAAGVLLTANALAAIPAMTTAHSRPGQLLRTE